MLNWVSSDTTKKAILHFACINILLEDVQDGKMRNQLLQARGNLVAFFKKARTSGQRSAGFYYYEPESGYFDSTSEPLARNDNTVPPFPVFSDFVRDLVMENSEIAFELLAPGFKESGYVTLPRVTGGQTSGPDHPWFS